MLASFSCRVYAETQGRKVRPVAGFICPKYDSCWFFINASSGFVALISSITDLLVRLAVHGIRSSLLQHHNSKLSILLLLLLLSAFLIAQDSQPCRTTGKTSAFTILHFVVIVYTCLSISCLILSLPLCQRPIISIYFLYRNPNLQCWHRGGQNPVLFLLSSHLIQFFYLFNRHHLGLFQM